MTFGTIGRLDPVKDQANLLHAFAALSRAHPDIQLRLLGDGALRHELEALATRLSIAESVHFDGFSLNTAGFLRGIDIYVISSRSEGLPLTLLEAMGAGLPVVSTSVGGIPDVLGRSSGNWLCAAENSDELARAMEQALLASRREEIGQRNRSVVEAHYSVERMTRDYQRLYADVLAERRGGSAVSV